MLPLRDHLPTRSPPVVNYALIALNFAVFGLTAAGGADPAALGRWALVPAELVAWLVILEFFAANLWNAFQPSSAPGGVAFVAHVGGFVAGLALLPLLRIQEPIEYNPWQRWLAPRTAR